MFPFGQKPASPSRSDNLELPDMPVVSESMLRRDNYFHNCWMLLKFKRPDLFIELDEIELQISGYNTDKLWKKDEPEKKPEDEGIIM